MVPGKWKPCYCLVQSASSLFSNSPGPSCGSDGWEDPLRSLGWQVVNVGTTPLAYHLILPTLSARGKQWIGCPGSGEPEIRKVWGTEGFYSESGRMSSLVFWLPCNSHCSLCYTGALPQFVITHPYSEDHGSWGLSLTALWAWHMGGPCEHLCNEWRALGWIEWRYVWSSWHRTRVVVSNQH